MNLLLRKISKIWISRPKYFWQPSKQSSGIEKHEAVLVSCLNNTDRNLLFCLRRHSNTKIWKLKIMFMYIYFLKRFLSFKCGLRIMILSWKFSVYYVEIERLYNSYKHDYLVSSKLMNFYLDVSYMFQPVLSKHYLIKKNNARYWHFYFYVSSMLINFWINLIRSAREKIIIMFSMLVSFFLLSNCLNFFLIIIF